MELYALENLFRKQLVSSPEHTESVPPTILLLLLLLLLYFMLS